MNVKNRTYINPELFSNSGDPFRSTIKKYWHVDTGQLQFGGDEAPGSPAASPTSMYAIRDAPHAAQFDIDGALVSRIIVGPEFLRSEPMWYNYRLSAKIIGNESVGAIEDDDHWREIVLSIVDTGTEYVDSVFDVDLPMNDREVAASNSGQSQLAGDVDYVYNYYETGYEEYTQTTTVSETLLPNLYVFSSALSAADDTIIETPTGDTRVERGTGLGYFKDPIFLKHITLNSALSEGFMYALRIKKNDEDEFYLTADEFYSIERYMREHAIVSATAATSHLSRTLEDRFSNLMFPVGSYSELVSYNGSAILFPFYSRITFGTEETIVRDSSMWPADSTTGESSQIKDLFTETNLFCSFMQDMMESFFLASEGETSVVEEQYSEVFRRPMLAADDSLDGIVTTNREIPLRGLDMTEWWENYYASSGTVSNAMSVIFGNMSMETRLATSEDYVVYKNMLMIIFAAKLRSIIAERHRRFDDILSGAKSYAETVIYRIAKFEGRLTETQTKTEIPVQNFWIPDTNETELVDIIDTQVKFDKDYTYIVYAYKIVIGTKYGYESVATSRVVSRTDPKNTAAGLEPRLCVELVDTTTNEIVEQRLPFNFADTDALTRNTTYFYTDEDNEFIAEFDIVFAPSIRVYEIPYMISRGAIVDSPPIAPEVTIFPYKGTTDKIKLFMKGAIGELSLEPITFVPEEVDAITRFRDSRNVSRATDEITYRSDDYPKSFQVYRTTVKPTDPNYSDFIGKLYKTVSTNWQDSGEVQYAAAAALDDEISPNKKYYYVFRAVDVHNNVSYPSPVYEVELVYDGNSVYPLINTIELEIPDGRTYKKSGKRLLKIRPVLDQRIMDEYHSGFDSIESAKELIITNDPPEIDLKLGTAENPIWGQKFKLRLTSKDTGRKVDINFEFKKQHVVTQFENT